MTTSSDVSPVVKLKDLPKGDRQGIRAANKLDKTGESRYTTEDKSDGYSRSYGTLETNKNLYRVAGKWAVEQPDIAHFDRITPEQCERFLLEKSVDISDKKIAGYAVALEHHLKITGGYDAPKLARPSSEIPANISSRAYLPAAVHLIESRQSARAALSTRVIDESGCRAHELHTFRRIDEREISDRRAWRDDRFSGREGWARYSVEGKGGLVREVRLTPETTARLEQCRLSEPAQVIDRNIAYERVYDLMGGKSYSNSFSKLSGELLGHSHGAHGLRHTYAQERMRELTTAGKSYDHAKKIVSQELGHFRPSITDIYLR